MVGAQCVQREREARQKAWELDHLGSGLPHRCHWGSCNACGCHSASPLATVLIAELVEPTLLRSSAESNDSTARSVSGGSSSSHAVASTLCAVVDATAWLELLELELLELNIVRARSLGSLLATSKESLRWGWWFGLWVVLQLCALGGAAPSAAVRSRAD